MNPAIEKLVIQLYDIGAIKFGSFKLKTGITSPIYFDLRVMVSFPAVLKQAVNIIWEKLQAANVKDDFVCGVPYTALPIASILSGQFEVPMVVCRKEPKAYGTGKDIEGVYSDGQTVVVIEDVVTSGLSVLETVAKLDKVKLVVKNVVAFLDREQGAADNLTNKGLNLVAAVKASELLDILEAKGKLDAETKKSIQAFFHSTKPDISNKTTPTAAPKKFSYKSYTDRIPLTKNQVAKQLFELMEQKKSNLCVAVDVPEKKTILELAEKIGPHIVMLKTHADAIDDFDASFVSNLVSLAKKHNFLIFEDRKFADIGNTVKMQYGGGVFKIADWAHVSNTHLVSGPSSVASLREVGLSKSEPRAMLLIAQMSTADTLASGSELAKLALETAEKYNDFVCGFITQRRLRSEPQESDDQFIYFTPGVHLSTDKDNAGQTYRSPQQVVEEGSDVIIVGRGISGAEDPSQAAILYKEAGWAAYVKRMPN